MGPDFLIIFLLIFLMWLTWWIFIRKKPESQATFSQKWRAILLDKVRYYQRLDETEKKRFERAILQFFEDVDITGVEIELNDTDRLLVACSAVIPLFGFPGWRYHNLNEVLLYDGTFNHDYQTEGKERNILGMVGSGAMQRMMILSRPALHAGFENRGSKTNVGIHEFVHLLDKADGAVDGIPEVLVDEPCVIPWLKEIHEEIRDIKNEKSDINPYGATNEAEFFSVASEYFFNQPQSFEQNHPELYEMMERVFRQDPA
jgi:hypothetical protein